MYAGREECRALQQARDVRVIDRIGREAQPGSDLRMSVGELGGQALDGIQFAFVLGEQIVRHQMQYQASLNAPHPLAGGGRGSGLRAR